KPPRVAYDAHRPLRPEEDLAQLFTLKETRRISRQLTVHYNRDLYVPADAVATWHLRAATTVVSEAADGTVTIRVNGMTGPDHGPALERVGSGPRARARSGQVRASRGGWSKPAAGGTRVAGTTRNSGSQAADAHQPPRRCPRGVGPHAPRSPAPRPSGSHA